MIAAGSDGSGAQAQIDRIVTGWRLRRVAEPLIAVTGAQTREAILAPKRVRLNLKDTSVVDAVKELEKQSQYSIQIQGDKAALAKRKVTLDTAAKGAFTAAVAFLPAFGPASYAVVADAGDESADAPLTVLAPPRLSLPVAVGGVRVGLALRCGVRVEAGAVSSIAWRRDGRLVARGPTYAVARRDRGHAVTCLVQARGPGGAAHAESRARGVSAARCVVPDVGSERLRAAVHDLRRAGCALAPPRRRAGGTAGRVVAVSPASGTRLRDGREVTLLVETG